jgi:hypothetical protein
VQRHERIVAGLDAELTPGPACARRLDVRQHRVDHRVPDEVHVVARDAFRGEVLDRPPLVDE